MLLTIAPMMMMGRRMINNTGSHPKDHRMGAGQRVGPQVASGLRGFPSTPLELSNSALSVLLSSSAPQRASRRPAPHHSPESRSPAEL